MATAPQEEEPGFETDVNELPEATRFAVKKKGVHLIDSWLPKSEWGAKRSKLASFRDVVRTWGSACAMKREDSK